MCSGLSPGSVVPVWEHLGLYVSNKVGVPGIRLMFWDESTVQNIRGSCVSFLWRIFTMKMPWSLKITDVSLEVVYLVLYLIPPAPKVIGFCHVSAWKCSKLWALTLTPCGVPQRWDVLCHRRTPWSVCTSCPPWPHSCSRPSAGISARLYRSVNLPRLCFCVSQWII